MQQTLTVYIIINVILFPDELYHEKRLFQSSLFAKWIFLNNFCSSDCLCSGVCFKVSAAKRKQWVIWLTSEIFSRAKLWIWKQLKVDIISLGNGCCPSFEQTYIPFPHGCWVPSSVENGRVTLDFLMYFRFFLPLKMGVVLNLNKLESPTPRLVFN